MLERPGPEDERLDDSGSGEVEGGVRGGARGVEVSLGDPHLGEVKGEDSSALNVGSGGEPPAGIQSRHVGGQ
ncbi:hypothetical protein ACFP3U_31620 [Kitasatospora misakiensis]|uniref:Uncharacterized protein n=1 Tax=Kitasatospora misakiensis TaxID=67330 RepID=A0ABW0XAR4_9ACTN